MLGLRAAGFVVLAIVALHCGATEDAAAGKDSLSQFNLWLEEGAVATGATARAQLVRVEGSTLRLEFERRPALAADMYPSFSLPLRSHVLGEEFMRTRPYYAALAKLSSTGTERQIQALTVSLMAEIAMWDASPIHPWCRLLLREPKSIGLSTPPILWPKDLADELEPRSILDAAKNRRLYLETFVDSSKGKLVLSAVDLIINATLKDLGGDRSTFSMTSNRNYLRVRAIVETCMLWSSPGGLMCIPFANFLETQASTSPNTHERYIKQTMKEPVMRRLSTATASVAGDVWSFHPREQDLRIDGGSLSPVVEVQTSNPFAVDEYFVTFGRLPTRVPWDTDCQLIVFSGGMSRERNEVKGNMASMMDDFLHHFSCLSMHDFPGHGLVAALISVLPSHTPTGFEACAQELVHRTPPVADSTLESFYRSLLLCLESANWKNPSDIQTILEGHKAALRNAITIYDSEQFRKVRPVATDENLLRKLSTELGTGGSAVERHAAVNLRYHRKLIVQKLLSRLQRTEMFEDMEDHIEL